MITLTVGPNKAYSSIQSAVDTIVNSVNGGALSQSVEIIVYEADYSGCVFPAKSLGTASTSTFSIKAAPNQRVVLSGWMLSPLLGHGHQGVGIGVGDNNPYVTIQGLRVENFHKGIVFGARCDYSNVLSNYVQLNANVGVWIYRSDFCEVANNVILDHDNGLVVTDVDDAFIAFNDIVNLTDPPSSAQGEKYAVHLTTLPPNAYGAGGAIVMYNNNIVASGGGRLIGYGPNVISKLRSDNNNFYNPGGVYAHDLAVGSAVPDSLGLNEWQTITNGDAGSVSVYPPYYIPTQAGNSIFTSVDLTNYLSYGGIGLGLNLANAPTASTAGSALIAHGLVPSYVDAGQLANTIQSNFANSPLITRPLAPSIGAYDTNNDPLGFGSSVLPVGVPGSGVNNSTCIGGFQSGINVVEEKYGQSVDCINPSLVPGFFYVRDVQHYLYSSKVGHYLGDITATDLLLASPLYDNIVVKLDDKEISSDHWRLDNNVLRLYHKGLNLTDLNRKVTVTATILKWLGNGFQRRQFRQSIRIKDGHVRYFLPDQPTRAAPIVITDDMVSYSDDSALLGWEFADTWDEQDGSVEITFAGPRNLLENPQFDYEDTGTTASLEWFTGTYNAPASWGIYGDTSALIAPRVITTSTGLSDVVASGQLTTGQTTGGVTGTMLFFTGTQHESTATGAYNLYPVIGDNLCALTGDGIRQRMRINEDKPYWVSTYAAALKQTGSTNTLWTGDLTFTVDFYDIEMRALGGQIVTGFTSTTDYTEPTGHWTRHSFMLSTKQDDILNKTGAVVSSVIPADAHFMDVMLGSESGMAFDGTAVTQSLDLKSYTRRIRGYEATIEYDTGLTDLYHAVDLTVTPIRNRNHNGFLYIAGVPAWQFDTGAPVDTTTLTDWNWATGRLEHLPWARTSGKNKLRNRPSFHIGVDGQSEDISIAPDLAYPDQIQLIPRVPIANTADGIGQLDQLANTGGSIGVKGADLTVRVTDDHGNPYAFEWVIAKIVDDLRGVPGANYVGLLGNREMGFYREFNQSVTVQLDSAGAATLRWVPPSAAETMVEVLDPFNEITVEDGERFIDNLPYRANEVGHANAFLSTPANPTGYAQYATGTTTAFLSPVMGPDVDGISAYSLASTPAIDTMRVWGNHTGLFPYSGAVTGAYDGTISQTYDLPLRQSEVPEIIDGQYFVDEARRLMFVRLTGPTNDPARSITTQYRERNTYLLAGPEGVVDERRLHISDSFYTTLTGDVSAANPLAINYDILVDLLVTAQSPDGITPEYEEVTEMGAPGGFIVQNIRERTLNATMVGKSLPKRVGLA